MKKKEIFIDKIERFIDKIEQFAEWFVPHYEKYEKILINYAKKLFLIIKTNILYIIWFLVYFYFTIVFISPIFGKDTFIISFFLYSISLAVAYLFGDIIFSLIEGARRLYTKREKQYLIPIFEEVYQDVKEIYPSLPKLRLHIIDSLTVNAVAIGRRTIAVTQGAVDTFNREELKGIFAHEISHIYYGDTRAVIINTIGNGIFAILSVAIKLFLRFIEWIAMMCDSKVIQAVFNLIRFIFEWFVFCILWLGAIILSLNSRGNEFKADKFAYETGYGEQLTQALYIIQKMSLGQKMNVVIKVISSHPHVARRIGRLEELEEKEINK